MYTESSVLTQVNNNFLGDNFEDGKLETKADGFGFGYSLHALYAFSEDTRVGFSYNSQISTDLDSTVDFDNVRRPERIIDRLQSQTIEVGSKVPMVAGMGWYHRMDNDWELTWDVMWVQFSKFGATSIQLDEVTLDAPDDKFDDFYVTSVGLTWPVNSRMSAAVGAFWMESPVDNADRSFAISLDEMMGVGAGITYQLDNGNDYELEVNLIDTGSSPIDTGPSLVKGRVAGKSKDHYSLAISLAYNWR
ncbi:Long-chain fatty acid transport protein [Halioglobus japonicus]|nr:Long-chain fatty acid transport protein [Halioglobus japonicus]